MPKPKQSNKSRKQKLSYFRAEYALMTDLFILFDFMDRVAMQFASEIVQRFA